MKKLISFIACTIIPHYAAEHKKEISIPTAIISGTIAGAAEGGTGVPCSFIKNQIQAGTPISAIAKIIAHNPFKLWSGISTNTSFMGPITATQTVAYAAIKQTILQEISEERKKTIAAIGSGAVAAIVATPAEHMIFRQHLEKKKPTMPQAIRTIMTRYGLPGLVYGYIPTASRDSIFTCSLFYGFPYDPTYGVGLGIASALVSQPFDTARTEMYQSEKRISFIRAAHNMVQERGVRSLWQGGIPRAIRLGAALPIMGAVQRKITPLIEHAER